MCITPIYLPASKEQLDDGYSSYFPVPCGKCHECLHRRSAAWTLRLAEEAKCASSVSFITLTYDEVPRSPQKLPTLDKTHLQRFFKRVRKRIGNSIELVPYYDKKGKLKYKPKYPLKYYACGEYGTKTLRPHYHAIVYNLPLEWLKSQEHVYNAWQADSSKDYIAGITETVPADDGHFSYVSKYVNKKLAAPLKIIDYETGELIEDDRQPEFALMSKGLGANFTTPAMKKYLTDKMEATIVKAGHRVALPRYYKEKIFTEEERKILAELGRKFKNERELYYLEFPELYDQWRQQAIKNAKEKLRMQRLKL